MDEGVAEILTEPDDVALIDALLVTETETDGEADTLPQNCHTAEVLVPIFVYTFQPVLSKSKNLAPL